MDENGEFWRDTGEHGLYIYHFHMRKQNKVVKLTEKDVKYIIRAKTKNDNIKNIAHDMKLSKSTVKRVWMHWIKHQEPIVIKKFGRKRKSRIKNLRNW